MISSNYVLRDKSVSSPVTQGPGPEETGVIPMHEKQRLRERLLCKTNALRSGDQIVQFKRECACSHSVQNVKDEAISTHVFKSICIQPFTSN